MKKILLVILVSMVLVSTWLAPFVQAQSFFFLEDPMVSKSAPDFELPTLEDKKVSFRNFIGGKKAIVFFWATWCPYCQQAIHNLETKKDEFDSQGIKVALVASGEPKDLVKRYMDREELSMDSFIDVDSLVSKRYNVTGLPTFIFINQDGVIQAVKHSLPEDLQQLF